MAKQIFVLDTCVLLHDPQAIYRFDEHDIYLPLAVIDDLDEQKTRRESVGWSAREVFRVLDGYNLKDLTSKGVVVNPQNGRLFIHNTELPNAKTDIPNISRVNSDNAIINAALYLKTHNPKRKVTIVTKDTGLRIRAQSWGCYADNYRSDLIEDNTYTGVRIIDWKDNDSKEWDRLWNSEEIAVETLSDVIKKQLTNLSVNEFVVFKWGELKCTTRYKNDKLVILKEKSNGSNSRKVSYMGITSNNLEQTCAIDVLSDESVSLVSVSGPAGTGKTILSLAVSLQQVFDGIYDRLIVIKPIIPFGGKDLGALPGDKWDKLSEWLGPMRDNIEQLVGNKDGKQSLSPKDISLDELVKNNIIEVEAMSYIQGRSIPNSIIIVDEAQNISPREARMVVERCGKNSKIILLGDVSQVENPYLDSRSCGLAHSMNGSRNIANCAVVTLSKVERSALAAIASEIFNQPEARR